MSIYAETNSKNRIQVSSEWYPDAPMEAKMVTGGRWDKAGRFWHYPMTLETCFGLRRVYGERLEVGPQLSRWARTTMAHEAKMVELGTSADAELEVVPKLFPRMAEAMANRTYQRAGAKFTAMGRSVGIFDEVGLGKTITSIGGIIEAGKFNGQHLVIANKTALWAVWFDQINFWTENKATVFVAAGTAKQREKVIAEFEESTAESKWLVINPHMLMVKLEDYCKKCGKFYSDLDLFGEDLEHTTLVHKVTSETRIHKYPQLQKIIWDSTIVDEAHKILSTGVKNAKQSSATQTGVGLMKLQGTKDYMKIALTGTPLRGKELALWGILHWLWPDTYTGKWAWVELYFHQSKDFMGHVIVGDLREDAKESFWKMIDRHCLRRTRAEVRADLPQSESYTRWATLEGAHEKQYRTFEEDGFVELDKGTLEVADVLVELTRLKQLAFGVWTKNNTGTLIPTTKSPKLELVVDMLEEFGVTKTDSFRASPNHYKYIIATQFTRVADMVEEHFKTLGIATLKITGDVTSRKRGEAVRSFQEDPDGPRVLIMNTYAGGESITVDRYCDTMFILDETFVADDQAQLYGRIDNRSVSAAEAVPRRFIHILTKGTIDERIAESNLTQLQIEHMILDKRRGIEISKLFTRKEM